MRAFDSFAAICNLEQCALTTQCRDIDDRGGDASIVIDAFEKSPAELFFRANDNSSARNTRVETGVHLSRYPNRQDATSNVNAREPALSDWAKIMAVENDFTIKVSGVKESRIQAWQKEEQDIWIHGLWTWNWADSHRKVTSINASAGTLTVSHDDSKDRDTLPIKVAASGEQGGFVYAENVVRSASFSSLSLSSPLSCSPSLKLCNTTLILF